MNEEILKEGYALLAQIRMSAILDKSEEDLREKGFSEIDTKYFLSCPRCGKKPMALGLFPKSAVVRCCGLEAVITSGNTYEEPITEMSAALAWGDLAHTDKLHEDEDEFLD